MAVTRVQNASSDGVDSPTTFGATPAEGNLLVVFAFSRSGTPSASHAISGSGWVKRISRDTALADTTSRRSLSCWTKVSGSSQPTTITVSGDTVRVVIQEFNDSGGGTWTFRQKADNDNGTTDNATAIATGTTASVSAGDLVLIGVQGTRRAAHTAAWTTAWTSSTLSSPINFGATSGGRFAATAFAEQSSSGTKASTSTISGANTTNTGHSAGIMVFELVAAGPASDEVTYAVEVEFVSGSFTNIKGDVKSISIARSIADLMHGITPGECNIQLYNTSGNYSPSRGAGPYFGNLTPNKRVRVLGIHDTVTYQLFNGFADEWAAGGEGKLGGMAALRARDQFRGLRDRTITTSLYVNYAVGSLFVDVLSASGVSSRTVSTLGDTLPFAWYQEAQPDQALNELLSLGFYRAYVDGAGVTHVKDRYYELEVPETGQYSEFHALDYRDNTDQIINDVFIEGVPREVTETSTLAYIVSPISIPASSHVAFVMQYIYNVNNEPTPATNHETPVSSQDWVLGTVAKGISTPVGATGADLTSTGSVSVAFFGETCVSTVFNGAGVTAYLNRFNIRGGAVPEASKISIRTRNTSSQNVFGRSTFSYSSDKLPGPGYVIDYETFLIDRFREPFPVLNLELRNEFPDVLDLDVGKRVTLTNSHLGVVGSSHVILRVEHEISTDVGIVHTVSIEAERFRNYTLFTLDDTVLGELDSGNQLSF